MSTLKEAVERREGLIYSSHDSTKKVLAEHGLIEKTPFLSGKKRTQARKKMERLALRAYAVFQVRPVRPATWLKVFGLLNRATGIWYALKREVWSITKTGRGVVFRSFGVKSDGDKTKY